MVIDIASGYIRQQALRSYIDARNRAREDMQRKREIADQLTSALMKGVPVEPGIHTAELKVKSSKGGKKRMVRLSVR